MAAESTATFLFDADGNIDRVRDTEGRVYYLASTLATTAAEAANAAAAKADTAAENADAATSAANNMETARREAETARVEAEKARELAQAKNNADQAANNSAAQGLQVVILGTGEYDPTTLEPTVTGAVGKMYMVPNPDADTDDAYIEWMLISGKWERVGLSNATIETLTPDQIDTVAADGQLVSDSVLNGTGLAYLWAKLRAAFAAIGHKHSVADVTGLQTALDGKAASSHTHNASDVTSGALSIAHGGTGAATAAAARTSLGAASAADLAEVRDSVSRTKIYTGSVVKHAGDSSVVVWTRDEFRAKFGAELSPTTFIGFYNGDHNKCSVHVDGASVPGDYSSVYATFGSVVSSNIRLNYLVVIPA